MFSRAFEAGIRLIFLAAYGALTDSYVSVDKVSLERHAARTDKQRSYYDLTRPSVRARQVERK